MSKHSKVEIALGRAIGNYIEKGMTYIEISERLGIHRETLRVWMRTRQDIIDGVIEAKNATDLLVEAAFFKSCMGETIYDKDGKFVEYVKPSVKAQMFWLNNRTSEHWKQESHITHGNSDERPLDLKLDTTSAQDLKNAILAEIEGEKGT